MVTAVVLLSEARALGVVSFNHLDLFMPSSHIAMGLPVHSLTLAFQDVADVLKLDLQVVWLNQDATYCAWVHVPIQGQQLETQWHHTANAFEGNQACCPTSLKSHDSHVLVKALHDLTGWHYFEESLLADAAD